MSWEPINLAKIEPRPRITPSIGGANLVYPGKRHVFSGPPESAKTLVAYAIALDEIRLGGKRLLRSTSNMGRWDTLDRLREMGATDDELERLFDVEPETPASEEIVQDLASKWTFSLVIIDAAAGAYSLQGLDDNLLQRRREVHPNLRSCIPGPRRRDDRDRPRREERGDEQLRDWLGAQGGRVGCASRDSAP